MTTYAKTTTVSVEKSKAEIERALKRWGATAFMFAWEGDRNLVAFKPNGLEARIPVHLHCLDLTALEARPEPAPTGSWSRCDYCPSCLTCWLSVCKEDDPYQARKEFERFRKGEIPWHTAEFTTSQP